VRPGWRQRAVRRALFVAGGLAAILAVVLGIGCFMFSAPRYNGPVSDHFDGRRFLNETGVRAAGMPGAVRWLLHREPGPWKAWTDQAFGEPPPERIEGSGMRVTFVNHATCLVQTCGWNVLTDPVWSERIGPVSFAGPKRARPPGIRFEDLPPVDVVLVSHNHYDHLDLATLRRLYERHHPRIYVPLGNKELLDRNGIPGSKEMDWWSTVEIGPGVRLTAVPAQHFSFRGLCDQDVTLWCGYVLQTPAGAAYFAGDTGMGPHFREIRARFGPPRLALLPIGAFRPLWFMSGVHTSPEDALQAREILSAGTSLAIHFGTFRLADDGQEEPATRLTAALAAHAAPRPRFWILRNGEGRDVP